MIFLVGLVLSYAIGTFPTGMLIAKFHGIDIASKGSGNVGATNVGRVIGKKAGLLTLVGDIAKGVLAVSLCALLSADAWLASLGAVAVVYGHCLAIPGKLKGGKGVATALGALIALQPLLAGAAAVLFGILFYLKKIVSLASVTAAVGVPLVALIANFPDSVTLASALIGLMVTARHHENLKRLVAGTEPQFASKKA